MKILKLTLESNQKADKKVEDKSLVEKIIITISVFFVVISI